MEAEPDWKELERIVADLHRLFDPQATIKNNDRIYGKQSGVLREIDVSIRRNCGCHEVLGIVDCKLRSRKVDVVGMGAFVALKADVAAHFAVIVNQRSFTKGAMTLAKLHGIHAMTVRDTKKSRWPTTITVPVAVFILAAVLGKVRMNPASGEPHDVDVTKVRLVDKQSRIAFPLWEWFVKDWQATPDIRAGQWKITIVGDDEMGNRLGELELFYAVTHDLYFKTVALDFLGLVNQESGIASTDKLQSDEIDFQQITSTWQRLDKLSKLSDGTLVIQMKMTPTPTARLEEFVRNPVLPPLKMVMGLSSNSPISIASDQPNDFRFGSPQPGQPGQPPKEQGT